MIFSNLMVINIVLYQGGNWILGKFANKLSDELSLLGHTVSISEKPVNNVDVNHHINYNDVLEKGSGINTVMITHIDTWQKWKKIKSLELKVNMFICMSADTKKRMVRSGIISTKVSYINPAHDHHFEFKKIRLGFFSNIYNDSRKGEKELTKAILSVNHSFFCIVIMGSGWEDVISLFKDKGVQYEWYQEFDEAKYIELIESIDYLVYTGFDEGSMSFLDAVMANKKTIVTSQGFHLDIFNGITHPIAKIRELKKILFLLSENHRKRKNDITNLTWTKYAEKHINLWDYLLGCNTTKADYNDGVTSLNNFKIPSLITEVFFMVTYIKFLIKRVKNKIQSI
jgi:hypothetical protein